MRRNPEAIIVEVKQLKIECNNKKKWQRSKTSVTFLNADKQSTASDAQGKGMFSLLELKTPTDRLQSECRCPLYMREKREVV